MTKNEALYKFFSGFGIKAFPITSEPENMEFPWIVYENVIANAGDPPVNCTANVYYYSESEAGINAKVDEIAEKIGRGGKQEPYDGGTIWISCGTPWSTPVVDGSDTKLKRRVLNLTLVYM